MGYYEEEKIRIKAQGGQEERRQEGPQEGWQEGPQEGWQEGPQEGWQEGQEEEEGQEGSEERCKEGCRTRRSVYNCWRRRIWCRRFLLRHFRYPKLSNFKFTIRHQHWKQFHRLFKFQLF